MAIAFVDDWHQPHAELSTFDVDAPAAGVPQGDTVIVTTVCSTSATDDITITDDQGNSYEPCATISDAGNVVMVAILAGYIATPLADTDQFHIALASHLGGDWYFSQWSGLAVNSFDKPAVDKNAFADTYSSGATATTTTPNELLIGALGTRHPPLTITPDSPWDELQNIDNGTDCMHVVQSRIVSATGAYASTGTINVDTGWVAAIATFAAADEGAAAMWVKSL